jgi:hypothetical protein
VIPVINGTCCCVNLYGIINWDLGTNHICLLILLFLNAESGTMLFVWRSMQQWHLTVHGSAQGNVISSDSLESPFPKKLQVVISNHAELARTLMIPNYQFHL